MNRIIDENFHVIPDVQDTDVHNAYWLMKRGDGDFHKWIADPKGAAARISELEKAKAEKTKKKEEKTEGEPEFDKEKFKEWAKTNPAYLEFAKRVNEAKASGDEAALKELLATQEDVLKKLQDEFAKVA